MQHIINHPGPFFSKNDFDFWNSNFFTACFVRNSLSLVPYQYMYMLNAYVSMYMYIIYMYIHVCNESTTVSGLSLCSLNFNAHIRPLTYIAVTRGRAWESSLHYIRYRH